MRCLSLFTAFTAFVLAAPAWPAIVYVNQNAPGTNPDGTTWHTAYTTVQQGIDAATQGDEVWVAAATYNENITVKSGVGLYGGFLGTETARSQRDFKANETILDGRQMGTVISIPADATSATIIDGFTIQNGTAYTPGASSYGGGILILGGNPVITNNLIQGCAAAGEMRVETYGGGIYVAGGLPLISHNVIFNNHAVHGGGIFALNGLIRDNVIRANTAYSSYLGVGFGGGIAFQDGAIIHNLIEDNVAPMVYGAGGGIGCNNAIVIGNTLIDNGGVYGGAMSCGFVCTVVRNVILDAGYSGGEVEFSGGVFANNLIAAHQAEAGLVLGLTWNGPEGGPQPVIANNTLYNVGDYWSSAVNCFYRHGEKPTYSNNNIVGWWYAGWYKAYSEPPVFTAYHNNIYCTKNNTLPWPGASQVGTNGNISQDPLFVDAANGDYRLQAGSPCIDAGNDAYVASGDRDAEGRPRIAGAHVDIGAYEYGSPLYTMLDAAEVLKIAAGFSICTPANVSRLNVVPESPGLTVTDATRIAQWLLN